MAQVRVVLCRPSHPGNIGSAARAMKSMGFTDLRLVAPEKFPAKEAEWMATNAGDVLERTTIHATLEEAIADCTAAYALSARPREWSPQVLDVRTAALDAAKQPGPVAFVFGNEQSGLTNEEVMACQFLVHIPASADFSSLNLSHAVQVVAYELLMAGHPQVPKGLEQKLATSADREGLYAHLNEAAIRSGFLVPETGSKLPERLRRLFSRVPLLEREEVNILRGLLKALLK
ncbi:MAG: RNA methyltransferase [Betaproteobacteria bacterium]|nr:RNA methyltransferase [Betaproteobacteria bacterium]